MKRNVILSVLILTLVIWLTACGSSEPPPNLEETVAAAVAETVAAQPVLVEAQADVVEPTP